MKLSEAIRLGSMLGPQLKNNLCGTPENGLPLDGTCAVGAALLAAGILDRKKKFWIEREPEAYQHFPLLEVRVISPVGGRFTDYLQNVVVDLNNNFSWTREQIADWVESVENQLDSETTPRVESKMSREIAAEGRN